MRTIWRSLAWKEWHEHKWKLASLSAVTCGVTGIILLAADVATLDAISGTLLVAAVPLSVFIGAGEAAGERAGRTMCFLQALPVPAWKSALWRLAFGAATCLVPILLALLLVAGWCAGAELLGTGQIDMSWTRMNNTSHTVPIGLLGFVVTAFVYVGTVGLSLFIWTAAIGVNRKSEVSAGAVSLLAVIVWWAAILWAVHGAGFGPNIWLGAAIAAAPGGLDVLLEEGPREPGLLWPLLAAGLLAHVALVAWYALRFGRTESVAAWSRQPARADRTHADWLGLPRRSPLAAIVWKQYRESGRLVLTGLAVIVPLGALASGIDPELPVAVTIYGGFLTALILGIGVFDSDLSPRLNTFWRSRPIDPDLWYWAKFLTGLIVLAVALVGPVVAVWSWLFLHAKFPASWRWWDILPVVTVLFAVYALALGMFCLVRMTIYVAVLSVAALCASAVVGEYFMRSEDVTPENVKLFILVTSTAAIIVATLVGWLVVRRDWGWKG